MSQVSATSSESSTAGRVAAIRDGVIVFKPAGTSYELHLQAPGYAGPVDEPVRIVIRIAARKIYTVPSGGNFVSPIFGPPKIVQGRVKSASESELLVHAGANFIVGVPSGDSAIDLNNGQIRVGAMVNVVALAGARAELVE